jgi:hypothetical protein
VSFTLWVSDDPPLIYTWLQNAGHSQTFCRQATDQDHNKCTPQVSKILWLYVTYIRVILFFFCNVEMELRTSHMVSTQSAN